MTTGLIVSTIISNAERKILIIKRALGNDVLPGYWDIPGGTLEDGEDPYDGAVREVKEETSLDIAKPKLFFQKSNIDAAKNKQFITLVFMAEYPGGQIRLNPKEHDEYAWINPSDVRKYNAVEYVVECLEDMPIEK